MRSTFSGLNTMVRGVFANQLSLDTVGHNITNASTEGYSRQRVNQAATLGQEVPSIYGQVMVGTGVDALSLQRARNIYADKQFWAETSTHEYYKTEQVNYDKLEAIFDDSDKTGILNAMEEFYKSWSDLSANASINSNRVTVIEKGNIFIDRLKTVSSQLQDQINAQYDDMRINVQNINDINNRIVELNKNIMTIEATGAQANDLRDQRDLLVDELSEHMNLNVYEDDKGMYSIVSNGITMVNGINKLTLKMSDPINNADYGVNDFTVLIKESDIAFIPQNGSLKAQMDTIAEDKDYIDKMADMAAFMLTIFNNMHQQGAGIDGTDGNLGQNPPATGTYTGPTYGINFFGDNNTIYEWDSNNKCVVATEMEAASIVRSLTNEVLQDENGQDILDVDGKQQYRPVVQIAGTTSSTSNLKGINIINAFSINQKISEAGGASLVAARTLSVDKEIDGNGAYTGGLVTVVNGPGDGTNAVNMSHLFNIDLSNISTTAKIEHDFGNTGTFTPVVVNTESSRSIGKIALNAYYNSAMSQLGTDANSVDKKESAQEDLITQIVNWRSSTSGVDWNEELTNMITFQKGYSACSRCLTTMDEMLDRLINSTGVVGR